MNLKNNIDSTYLKTPQQAYITLEQNNIIVAQTIDEAIQEKYKLVMLLPNYVAFAKKRIQDSNANLAVGTVIAFPEGTNHHPHARKRLSTANKSRRRHKKP